MPDSTNTGGRKPRVADDDLLDVFRATTDPVLSTAEVADAVPIKRRGTLNRLRDLEDADRIDSKQIGGRNTVWWLLDDDRPRPTPDQPPTNPDAVDDRDTTPDSGQDTPPAEDTGENSPESGDEIAAAIARVDTPGSGETRERREQALRDAYEYLRAEGTAQRSDFEDLLGDDVGYNGGFRSWWTNYVKAKDALKQLPNVDPPGEGEHTWTYTGDDVEDGESGIYDPTEEF